MAVALLAAEAWCCACFVPTAGCAAFAAQVMLGLDADAKKALAVLQRQVGGTA
jgi:hypothetical protein